MSTRSSFPQPAQARVQEQRPGKLQRRHIVVQGIVQGVGFRPFVYTLARRYHLAGFVFNDSVGVTIEVEGEVQALECFVVSLRHETPPLARIDQMQSELLPICGETDFAIISSHEETTGRSALISPDTAV